MRRSALLLAALLGVLAADQLPYHLTTGGLFCKDSLAGAQVFSNRRLYIRGQVVIQVQSTSKTDTIRVGDMLGFDTAYVTVVAETSVGDARRRLRIADSLPQVGWIDTVPIRRPWGATSATIDTAVIGAWMLRLRVYKQSGTAYDTCMAYVYGRNRYGIRGTAYVVWPNMAAGVHDTLLIEPRFAKVDSVWFEGATANDSFAIRAEAELGVKKYSTAIPGGHESKPLAYAGFAAERILPRRRGLMVVGGIAQVRVDSANSDLPARPGYFIEPSSVAGRALVTDSARGRQVFGRLLRHYKTVNDTMGVLAYVVGVSGAAVSDSATGSSDTYYKGYGFADSLAAIVDGETLRIVFPASATSDTHAFHHGDTLDKDDSLYSALVDITPPGSIDSAVKVREFADSASTYVGRSGFHVVRAGGFAVNSEGHIADAAWSAVPEHRPTVAMWVKCDSGGVWATSYNDQTAFPFTPDEAIAKPMLVVMTTPDSLMSWLSSVKLKTGIVQADSHVTAPTFKSWGAFVESTTVGLNSWLGHNGLLVWDGSSAHDSVGLIPGFIYSTDSAKVTTLIVRDSIGLDSVLAMTTATDTFVLKGFQAPGNVIQMWLRSSSSDPATLPFIRLANPYDTATVWPGYVKADSSFFEDARATNAHVTGHIHGDSGALRVDSVLIVGSGNHVDQKLIEFNVADPGTSQPGFYYNERWVAVAQQDAIELRFPGSEAAAFGVRDSNKAATIYTHTGLTDTVRFVLGHDDNYSNSTNNRSHATYAGGTVDSFARHEAYDYEGTRREWLRVNVAPGSADVKHAQFMTPTTNDSNPWCRLYIPGAGFEIAGDGNPHNIDSLYATDNNPVLMTTSADTIITNIAGRHLIEFHLAGTTPDPGVLPMVYVNVGATAYGPFCGSVAMLAPDYLVSAQGTLKLDLTANTRVYLTAVVNGGGPGVPLTEGTNKSWLSVSLDEN